MDPRRNGPSGLGEHVPVLDVLAVCDCAADLELLRAHLHAVHEVAYRFAVARSLAEAQRWLPDNSVDCVVLHLDLPDCPGTRCVERVRETAPDVPVVAISDVRDDGVAALDAGAQDCLPKHQVSGDTLGRAIRFAVARHRRAQARRASAEQQKLAALGRLAAGVSHDFGNHLQVIAAEAELIDTRGQLGDADRTSLARIRQQAGAAAASVRQILGLARERESHRRPFELGALLAETLRMVEAALPSGVTLTTSVPTAPVVVEDDPVQLAEVVTNLVFNAVDAVGGRGCIEVAVGSGDDGDAFVSVRDDGSGIAPEHLGRIFEPFFTTKGDGGTGLGLAQVRGLVRAHGGDISVESRIGEGSTFTIRLPAPTFDSAPEPPRPPIRAAAPDPAEGRRGDGETVLVVDDEPDIRSVVGDMLEHLGYRVLTAAGPQEALDLFRAHPNIRAVFTDVSMPGGDGTLLARELAQTHSDVGVALLTAHDRSWQRLGAAAARGSDDDDATARLPWVQKPVDLESLAATAWALVQPPR